MNEEIKRETGDENNGSLTATTARVTGDAFTPNDNNATDDFNKAPSFVGPPIPNESNNYTTRMPASPTSSPLQATPLLRDHAYSWNAAAEALTEYCERSTALEPPLLAELRSVTVATYSPGAARYEFNV